MSTETTPETVGARIKRLRLEQQFTQRSLAAPGVTYAYISRIEAGTREPSVKALRKIAARLGVTPAYLETGVDAVTVDREILERLRRYVKDGKQAAATRTLNRVLKLAA